MVKHLKIAFRKELLAKRGALTQEEITKSSNQICEQILLHKLFSSSKVIGIYLAKGNEVTLDLLIKKVSKLGKELCVPVLESSDNLAFYKLQSFEDLEKGKFGILEPKTRIPPSKKLDLIIVPGVAFDLHCHRLGFGKGYYDRYLADFTGHSIGVCYNFQLVDILPREDHDKQLDEIITEKRVIRKKSSP